VLALICLGGCSAGSPAGSNVPASTQTVTVGTRTAAAPPAVTLTSPVAGGSLAASAPPPTNEPAPVDGTCPYLDNQTVADINGQRTGTTQIIDVAPYPVCVFTRTDGEWLASVRVIQADTAESAVAAVNEHVPIDGSDPANQPQGWTGGSMTTPNGSLYAVSKGPIAIVAESNQQQSIKGRQLVVQTVTNLGL
jgi:hypothetical protein